MIKEDSIINNLENAIKKQGNGILLLVKLKNQHELNIVGNLSDTIRKFHQIVGKICQDTDNYKLLKADDPTALYVIVPNDVKIAEKAANIIYSQIQAYIDNKFPEIFLKSAIGSIKFTNKQEIQPSKLLSLLKYGMEKSGDVSYYYHYDDDSVDIAKLKDNNTKLNMLKEALLGKKAKFMYQPIVDRKSGNISYYECLLRIIDENNKAVSVGAVIENAESNGMTNLIDFTVLEMAIDELVRDKTMSLSVNISNIGVLNKRLLKKAETLLKKHNVANRLIIEITETSLNHDFARAKHFIDTLHQYGCRFALDDFGSGFTSFKQLLKLPIDIIKIDGSYVRDILSNESSKFFVEALNKLASDLGIKTVAEFVENGEIAKFLIDMNIGAMQGNFFLPASESRVG